MPLLTEQVHEGLTTWELYQDTSDYDSTNTLRALAGTAIAAPPKIDRQLIGTYLAYFAKIGLIEPPAGRPS